VEILREFEQIDKQVDMMIEDKRR